MPLSSLFLCEVEQLQEVQSFTPGYTALLQRTGDSEWNPLLQVRQNSCYACQKSTVNHPRSEGRTVLFPTLSASGGFVHDWQQKRRWFGIWESFWEMWDSAEKPRLFCMAMLSGTSQRSFYKWHEPPLVLSAVVYIYFMQHRNPWEIMTMIPRQQN